MTDVGGQMKINHIIKGKDSVITLSYPFQWLDAINFIVGNNQSMIVKTSSSARQKTPQRSTSHLSEKRCKTNIFLNQKISHLINIKYLDSPMKTSNKILFVPQSRYCQAVSPQQIPSNSKSALFDRNYRNSSDTFRHVLRHNASKQSKNRTFSLKHPITQSKQTSCKVSESKNNSFSFKQVRTRMLEQYDFAQTVRKQIEQRFERTKMIFKEQAKIKKLQKIHQIYEKKLKVSRRLNVDKEGNDELKSNEYQPWEKNRLRSCEESICEVDDKQG